MLYRAGVVELADALDSKSCGSDTVSVRPRSPAPSKKQVERLAFLCLCPQRHNIITSVACTSFARLRSTSFRFSGHKMMLSTINDVAFGKRCDTSYQWSCTSCKRHPNLSALPKKKDHSDRMVFLFCVCVRKDTTSLRAWRVHHLPVCGQHHSAPADLFI